ncbi:UDP-3-O-(3-hydroxymyristoyl)glucosamine N-acyltransferase [Puniceicoccaceae bacterium K14]|nr:UDP-3-O-(3-hydroxymyristoyl)glucosamine N-acyltransferase [Puniceicoccaceae bacterium K14]
MKIEISIDQVKDASQPSRESGSTGIESISGVATLTEAVEGDLSFLGSAKHKGDLESTLASVIFVPQDTHISPKENQLFLYTENPSMSLAKVCEIVASEMWIQRPAGVHPSAHVSEDAEVDPTAYIGPNCVLDNRVQVGPNVQLSAGVCIGEGVEIGECSTIATNVTIVRDSVIGKRVQIHPGVVIGSDGFGYEPTPTGIYKIPQVGNVEIGDDVEIGANTTIDRGRLNATRIGFGTKIDNQVQIGHNVQIGNCCILCAQVGIAGSTIIEDFVVMGGRSGASGHIKIEKGAQLAGCAVAFSNLEAGGKYGGSPAMNLMTFQRITAITQRLPEMFKRIRKLESALKDS